MIEKPKRPKKIPNQDNKQPQTIQELIRRYDLDNTKIYDFLDELVGSLNKKDTYSTDEQVIGTWIDGKPLYRKVIEISNVSFDTVVNINTNLSNIDFCYVVNACILNSEGASRPIMTSDRNATSSLVQIAPNGIFYYYLGSSLTGFDNLKAILEYTKTTD